MASSRQTPRHIAITRVRAADADAFEAFVRDEIVPLVSRHRPHLAEHWELLRPDEPVDDVMDYALLFYGDASLEDWELSTLFSEAHGAEAGEARTQRFTKFVVDDEQQVISLGEPVRL